MDDTTPAPRCPNCDTRMVPIVYGHPGPELWEAEERGEVILAGCVVGPVAPELGCPSCGAPFEPPDALSDQFGYDAVEELPRSTRRLVRHALDEAAVLQRRADAAQGRIVAAGAVCALIGELPVPGAATAVARFGDELRLAAMQVDTARQLATAAHARIASIGCELWGDDGDGVGPDVDDEVYESVRTVRLHVPVAASMLDDAMADLDAVVATVGRLALAVAAVADGTDHDPADVAAARIAGRGLLRLDRSLADGLDEDDPRPWALDTDELVLEVTGLMAQALDEHRTFVTISSAADENRFVQFLCDDVDLLVESVGDRYLTDRPLSPADHDLLVELGFDPPASDGRPNWHRYEPEVDDVAELGRALVRVLADVHGISDSTDVEIAAGPSADAWAE